MKARQLIQEISKKQLIGLIEQNTVWTAVFVPLYNRVRVYVDRTEEGVRRRASDFPAMSVEPHVQQHKVDGPVKDRIWVAVIVNEDGQDTYVALTEDELYADLALFCHYWWHRVAWDDGEGEGFERPPEDPRELVQQYFERSEEENVNIGVYPL